MLLVDISSLLKVKLIMFPRKTSAELNSCVCYGRAYTAKINTPSTVLWHEIAYVHIVKPSYSAKTGWLHPHCCVNSLTTEIL